MNKHYNLLQRSKLICNSKGIINIQKYTSIFKNKNTISLHNFPTFLNIKGTEKMDITRNGASGLTLSVGKAATFCVDTPLYNLRHFTQLLTILEM